MKNSLRAYLLTILIFFPIILEGAIKTPYEYLTNRMHVTDKRYPSFLFILRLLEQRRATVLVETGTARNGTAHFDWDGNSTVIFADWAKQNNAKLYTVDISPSAIESAKNATKPYKDCIIFSCQDSIQFLADFEAPIDFLYLDSFDFDEK